MIATDASIWKNHIELAIESRERYMKLVEINDNSKFGENYYAATS